MAFESLRVLKSRNYALVWWSGSISSIGTWMQTVAVGALVISLTHKAAWGGAVAAVAYLSSGLATPLGGVIADRHDRRRLLIAVSTVEAVVAFVLACLYFSGAVKPWVLLVNVALEGLLLGLYIPASSALMPDLVDRAQLPNAAALGNASWNLGRTLGPAVGGLVLLLGSYGLVFMINAVSFLVVALALLMVRVKSREQRTDSGVWQRLRDGLAGARADEGCWAVIKTTALVALTVSPFIALMPSFAQLVFHGSAIDTSHLVIAQGVGSVVGAFALAPLAQRFGRHHMMLFFLVSIPIVEMAYSQAPTKEWAIAGAALMGVNYVGILIGLNIITQLRAPAHLRARVLSINFTILSLAYPIGSFVQGWIGDHVGVRTVLFFGPAVFLVCLGLIAVMQPRWLASLDAPASASSPGGPVPSQEVAQTAETAEPTV